MDKGADHSDPPAPANTPLSAALALPSPDRPVPSEYDLFCESCGYSLLGLMTDRCPECGQWFDPTALPLARVPWLYRKRLGRLRAYVRTVRMIVRDPADVAAELRRPVRISASDAQAFRRMSVIALPLAVIATATIAFGVQMLLALATARIPLDFDLLAMTATVIVTVWLCCYFATDMPTFIWRGLDQDPEKLAPVHHYASAPLALSVLLLPLSVLLLVMCVSVREAMPGAPGPMPWYVLAATTLPLWRIAWLTWVIPLRLMGPPSPSIRGQRILLGLYLPFHWLLMALLAGLIVVTPFALVEQLFHVIGM